MNTHTYNNSSTPDVYATKFSIPVGARFCGCWYWIDADGDYTVKLYDSDGVTVLSSLSSDNDLPPTPSAGIHQALMSSVDIEPGVDYFLGIEPSSGTNISTYSFDVNAAYLLGQVPGGVDFRYATAKDPSGTGSWTETSTRRIFIEPMFDAVNTSADAGAGGDSGDAGFASQVQSLINRIGQNITYQRVTPGNFNQSTLQMGSENVTEALVKASVRQYRAKEIQGLIQQGDREVRIAAVDLSFTPSIKDCMVIGDKTFQVIGVNTRAPQGEDAVHIIQVRGGNG